ncbi:MAG: hypothetical protein ACTSRS_10705 [Candidatus Helarchaeota archaeon]
MNKYAIINIYSYFCLIFNAVTILFNSFSYLGLIIFNSLSIILFFIAFGSNLTLIYINLNFVNRVHSIGKRIKLINQIYLLFCLFAVLILFMQSAAYSFFAVGLVIRDVIFIITVIFYFGIFGFGFFASYVNLQYIKDPNVWK